LRLYLIAEKETILLQGCRFETPADPLLRHCHDDFPDALMASLSFSRMFYLFPFVASDFICIFAANIKSWFLL
jgi:hypothetical protein